MNKPGVRPALSVVINILLGPFFTRRCIDTLLRQQDAPQLEIIVPYCPEFDDVSELRRAYPDVLFPIVDGLPRRADLSDPGLAHMIFDRRRAVGLSAATGEIIALTEDQIVPHVRWCAALVEAHAVFPHGAIGGAVEDGGSGPLHRALYLCDFGRYAGSFEAGEAAYLTDQNVSYKRTALENIRHVWEDMYHEPEVHEALKDAGEVLWLVPSAVVQLNRPNLRVRQQLRERWAWGRVFGGARAQRVSTARRLGLLVVSPLIPALIISRLLRRNSPSWGVSLLSAVSMMAVTWAVGEAIGYATAEPFPTISED